MITLTAEVLCDSCGKVCGVGEPTPEVATRYHWVTSAIELAERKARSHGAQINVASVTCAECQSAIRGRTLILRGFLEKMGCSCPESYEWLDGEAWYRGEPIQSRATESEQMAINATLDALEAARILRTKPTTT